jgi:hypothetical protein
MAAPANISLEQKTNRFSFSFSFSFLLYVGVSCEKVLGVHWLQ